MLVLKYSMVSFKPFSNETFGSQLSNFLAFVISGRLCFGSSCGSGLKTILLFELVNFLIK
jgi:hypothetical protein